MEEKIIWSILRILSMIMVFVSGYYLGKNKGKRELRDDIMPSLIEIKKIVNKNLK